MSDARLLSLAGLLLLAPAATAQVRVEPASVRLAGPDASLFAACHAQQRRPRPSTAPEPPATRPATRTSPPWTNAASSRPSPTAPPPSPSGSMASRNEVAVRVEDSAQARDYHFENDIIPLLSRYGCNSSGCHGKAEGQNGFKLSVFGFDPAADYAAWSRRAAAGACCPAAPEMSLFLRKMSGPDAARRRRAHPPRHARVRDPRRLDRRRHAVRLGRRADGGRASASSRASGCSTRRRRSSCASSRGTATAARST